MAYALTNGTFVRCDTTDVASSDATIFEPHDGEEYVINGENGIPGAGDPRCAVFIVMGKLT